jgi:hypothetical protein
MIDGGGSNRSSRLTASSPSQSTHRTKARLTAARPPCRRARGCAPDVHVGPPAQRQRARREAARAARASEQLRDPVSVVEAVAQLQQLIGTLVAGQHG